MNSSERVRKGRGFAVMLAVFLACRGAATGDENKLFALGIPGQDAPSGYAIVLTNDGPCCAQFRLVFNDDGFFSSTDELVRHITAMLPEVPGEPAFRKTWRFVRAHYTNDYPSTPLTGLRWQHSPSLFINSLGFGYCDDAACVTYFLWKRQGYEARVWALNHHVVPEIRVEGRWEMYDPDPTFGGYYHAATGRVAGVEDLLRRPDLVSKPIQPIHPLTNMAYSAWMASAFSPTDRVAVSDDWYMGGEADVPLQFEIPPHGSLAFPLPPDRPLKVEEGKPPPDRIATAELSIPAAWTGQIGIALVVHAIDGDTGDTVTIGGKTFHVGSQALQDFIDRRTTNEGEFFCELRFAAPARPVRVRYLVNPLLVRMKQANRVSLSGTGLAGVSAALRRIGDPGGEQKGIGP